MSNVALKATSLRIEEEADQLSEGSNDQQTEEIKEGDSDKESLVSNDQAHEKFVYESKIVLRTELEEEDLKNELAVKKMNYSQHEYVKINEVGQLI